MLINSYFTLDSDSQPKDGGIR